MSRPDFVSPHRVKAGAAEFFASIEDREAGFDRYPEYVREQNKICTKDGKAESQTRKRGDLRGAETLAKGELSEGSQRKDEIAEDG